MANITPTQALGTGYDLVTHNNVQGIFVPLGNITGLSQSEAHPTTGDGRKVIAGLIELINDRIQSLQPSARPVNLTIAKAQPSGVAINQVNQSFTITIRYNTAFANIVEVADEPVNS